MGEFVMWAMKNTPLILGGFVLIAIVMTVFLMKIEKIGGGSIPGHVEESGGDDVAVKPGKWKSGVADKWESDEHRALLVMCMGDTGKAERLIEFERDKTPSGDRASWIKEAIARWGRDLHRL